MNSKILWTIKMTTLHLSHKKKKNVNSKKCQNIKLNNNTSLNEEFITEVH
jgi:hypothetical protein